MFWFVLKTRFICSLRDRQLIFWSFLYPLAMAMLFGMAFSNIGKSDAFTHIPVAVVNDAAYQADAGFSQAIAGVSGSDDGALFTLTKAADETQAQTLLRQGKITGYFVAGSPVRVVVADSGYQQTILQVFADAYEQNAAAFKSVAGVNPAGVQAAISAAQKQVGYVRGVSPARSKPDLTLTYYFALIAMACFYGAFWGMNEVNIVQANITTLGARMNLAPVHKLKLFGASLCAVTPIHTAACCVLVAFLRFALHVDFGGQTGHILLTCFAGSLAGVALGAVGSAVARKSQGLKVAVLITTTMVFSFLAGMMYANMKYIIARHVPVLSYLNPVNLVADALYSLYYYTSHARFFLNIGLLFAFSLILYFVIYLILRRQRYASV